MAARRQHLLDFAILGLLHEAPMHGYELRKRLNQALGPFRAGRPRRSGVAAA